MDAILRKTEKSYPWLLKPYEGQRSFLNSPPPSSQSISKTGQQHRGGDSFSKQCIYDLCIPWWYLSQALSVKAVHVFPYLSRENNQGHFKVTVMEISIKVKFSKRNQNISHLYKGTEKCFWFISAHYSISLFRHQCAQNKTKTPWYLAVKKSNSFSYQSMALSLWSGQKMARGQKLWCGAFPCRLLCWVHTLCEPLAPPRGRNLFILKIQSFKRIINSRMTVVQTKMGRHMPWSAWSCTEGRVCMHVMV